MTADELEWAEAKSKLCGWSVGDLLTIAGYWHERDELLDLAVRTGVPPADIAKALRGEGAGPSFPQETPK